MQGWQPKYSSFSRSRSTSSRTAPPLSFISPRILTEPGVMSRYFSMFSGEAKDSRAEPICFESSLVLKGFSPGMTSR